MNSTGLDQQTQATLLPLRVETVSRSFGGLQAVDRVSFKLSAGERLAILGPNGAGKSTLFNLVCGDLAVDTGRVFLRGEDVTTLPLHQRVRRGLARTYQTSSVFSGLTVGEHLMLARRGPLPKRLSLRPSRSGQSQDAEAARRLAAQVGLQDRLGALGSNLSHGELRQLEVAMALAAEPFVILLDEPAAGLSPAEREHLTELLLNLQPSVAVVLVEHDMDVALTVADRVLVLESGRLIAEGKPEEIETDPLVQAVYLGEQHDQSQSQAQ